MRIFLPVHIRLPGQRITILFGRDQPFRQRDPKDKIIKLDDDVTEESSKRSVEIHDTLCGWLTGPFKVQGKLWTGSHDEFYRMK